VHAVCMLDESLEAQMGEFGKVGPLLEALIPKPTDHLPIETDVPSTDDEVNLCLGEIAMTWSSWCSSLLKAVVAAVSVLQ